MASPEATRAAAAPVGGGSAGRRPPVLVTGVPRSGTTWLARQLATVPGTGLAGREPMNPRTGQFALAGTLSGWTVLEHPTAGQARVLRRCYRGLEPRLLSRYGHGQLRSVLPWTTTIVKDPFALLSLPAVVRATGAVPVVVFRHPGAVLASYRRMGWTADTQEVAQALSGSPGPAPADDAEAMVAFWNALHRKVLDTWGQLPGALLVSHSEVSAGGTPALAAVATACGLGTVPARDRDDAAARDRVHRAAAESGRLHRFDRSAQDVAQGWRSRLTEHETDLVERGTAQLWSELLARRTPLTENHLPTTTQEQR